MKLIASLFTVLFSISTSAQTIKTFGVKVNVTDMDLAKNFYCDKLGFKVESTSGDYVFLKTNGDTKLVLHMAPHFLPETEKEVRAGLSLQVNDLDRTIASLKSKGVDFGNEQKRKEGVGYAIFVKDPFGKQISLMQVTIVKTEPFQEPKIYNYGFRIPDMNEAIGFYTRLGFVELSKKYLPSDMPLGNSDNTFGFMLHFREGTEPMRHNSSDTQHVALMFQTTDFDRAIAQLKEKGIQVLQKLPIDSPMGRYISFYDPFGYLSELIDVKK